MGEQRTSIGQRRSIRKGHLKPAGAAGVRNRVVARHVLDINGEAHDFGNVFSHAAAASRLIIGTTFGGETDTVEASVLPHASHSDASTARTTCLSAF